MQVNGQHHAPASSPPVENPGAHWGLGGPQSGSGHFGEEEKCLASAGIRAPDRPFRSLVNVPTEPLRTLKERATVCK
jgi:hypothetical protein